MIAQTTLIGTRVFRLMDGKFGTVVQAYSYDMGDKPQVMFGVRFDDESDDSVFWQGTAEAWAYETNLHAHITSDSYSCDGHIHREDTLWLTDEERADEFTDIRFHERVVNSVVSTYGLLAGATLKVEKFGEWTNDVRLYWEEPTEEGMRYTDAEFCADDCPPLPTDTYRDMRAEQMGY